MSNEGTVVRVDPATLIVAANVRSNTKVTKEFVASVKLHGVMVPITAHEAPAGLAVVDGQRRTLAAVDAGVAEVPVYVIAEVDEAHRIVDQVVVNEHRESLDQVEQVLALKELEQLGVSAAAIAKRTGTQRKAVDGALAVGSSEPALAAMQERQLSFDAAIAIAEFDDDPEAQARVIQANGTPYTVQQERSRRDKAKLTAELEAQGLIVIDQPSYDSVKVVPVDSLYTGPKRSTSVGSLPHEQIVERAGDGLRVYLTYDWADGGERVLTQHYAIAGWQERGLFADEWRTRSSSATTLTPEEQAAAKEERRLGRERTKAWDVATGVRVAWLQEVLQRRTMPKGWELLAARQALGELYGYPWSTVLGLLGLTRSDNGLGKYDVVTYLDEHPAKAAQVALALALGSIEGARDFDRKGWQSSGAKPYLELLASWGYELSDVEREIVADKTAAAA